MQRPSLFTRIFMPNTAKIYLEQSEKLEKQKLEQEKRRLDLEKQKSEREKRRLDIEKQYAELWDEQDKLQAEQDKKRLDEQDKLQDEQDKLKSLSLEERYQLIIKIEDELEKNRDIFQIQSRKYSSKDREYRTKINNSITVEDYRENKSIYEDNKLQHNVFREEHIPKLMDIVNKKDSLIQQLFSIDEKQLLNNRLDEEKWIKNQYKKKL